MKQETRRHIEVVAGVIRRERMCGTPGTDSAGRLVEVFATQRGYGEFKDGWEFPDGKFQYEIRRA